MPFLPPYICVSVYITKWGEVSARARADLSRQEAQMHVHGKLILVLSFTKYETYNKNRQMTRMIQKKTAELA